MSDLESCAHLDAAYARMAADEEREAEAREWVEALIRDAAAEDA